MKLTKLNGFLTRQVMGARKSCSEYIFLKKTIKDCPTVLIQKDL